MTISRSALLLATLLLPGALPGQSPAAPDTLLAGITERGRALHDYDAAASLASDALRGLSPAPSRYVLHVVRRTPSGWVVRFGRFAPSGDDTLLVAYEASGASLAEPFRAVALAEPRAADAHDLAAARAKTIARAAFGPTPRPYSYVAVPAPGGQWWVYVLPARTRPGVYPHGADARFRLSPDGRTVLDVRVMHNGVLESGPPPPGTTAATHTAVRDTLPEDTDVFHVLVRRPAIPELVVTERVVFEVRTDGSIVRAARPAAPRPAGVTSGAVAGPSAGRAAPCPAAAGEAWSEVRDGELSFRVPPGWRRAGARTWRGQGGSLSWGRGEARDQATGPVVVRTTRISGAGVQQSTRPERAPVDPTRIGRVPEVIGGRAAEAWAHRMDGVHYVGAQWHSPQVFVMGEAHGEETAALLRAVLRTVCFDAGAGDGR